MGWNCFEMRGKFCIRSAEPDGAAPLLRGLRPSEVPAERSWRWSVRLRRVQPAGSHVAFPLLPQKEYCGIVLPAARYTADYVLVYADGTVEVVEIKSKFTRRAQRDYIYRRRLFIDLIAEPKGYKFTEIITPDSKSEIKEWKRLAEQVGRSEKL